MSFKNDLKLIGRVW